MPKDLKTCHWSNESELRVLTCEVRLAFADLFTPREGLDNKGPKYGVTMLIDPTSCDCDLLEVAADRCVQSKFGKRLSDCTGDNANPFKDGGEKGYDGFDGMVAVKATSKFAPKVVDQNVRELTADSTPGIASGDYARCAVSPYAWKYAGKVGVSFNLHNVQFVRPGERFGSSRLDPSEEFDALDTEVDDIDNL